MSVQAITFVIGQHIPDAGAKLLAMVLANYVDHRTGLAWPTVEALADDTSQSVRTVQRKLRELEQLGLITILKGACPKTGRQRANRYVMHLPGVAVPARGDRPGGAAAVVPARGDSLTPHLTPQGCQPDGEEGDTGDTPGGDTAVTPLKESVRGTVTREAPQPPVAGGRIEPVSIRENGATAPPEPPPPDPAPEAGAVGLFDQLVAAYPEGGRAWANLAAARALFDALPEAEQRQAIAAAAAYAAHCRREAALKPKYLQNWLRAGLFRNHRLAPAPAEPPRAVRVFVAADTPDWSAWAEHHRRQGRPMPTPVRSDVERREGWWFASPRPPEPRPGA